MHVKWINHSYNCYIYVPVLIIENISCLLGFVKRQVKQDSYN